MLKSNILDKLHSKHNYLKKEDIENVFDILIKKLVHSLSNNENIELRGFGTISAKENKEKFVRNPKTNEKIFKPKSIKIHFKIGKTLHKRLNSNSEAKYE